MPGDCLFTSGHKSAGRATGETQKSNFIKNLRRPDDYLLQVTDEWNQPDLQNRVQSSYNQESFLDPYDDIHKIGVAMTKPSSYLPCSGHDKCENPTYTSNFPCVSEVPQDVLLYRQFSVTKYKEKLSIYAKQIIFGNEYKVATLVINVGSVVTNGLAKGYHFVHVNHLEDTNRWFVAGLGNELIFRDSLQTCFTAIEDVFPTKNYLMKVHTLHYSLNTSENTNAPGVDSYELPKAKEKSPAGREGEGGGEGGREVGGGGGESGGGGGAWW